MSASTRSCIWSSICSSVRAGFLGLAGAAFLVLEAAGLAVPVSSVADLAFVVLDFVVLGVADLAFEPSVDLDLAVVSFAFAVLDVED